MISEGYLVGDGSWTLRVYVTDLQVERTLRVKGDLHIGGVMLKLVEDLDIAMDWSDHALWWPKRNKWLSQTRQTLDQCGVQADALLHFTPMHKNLRVQLPDLRYLDVKADFSVKTFNAVIQICKVLGIRHPEELSFCKPLEPNHLKYNFKDMPKKRHDQNGTARNGHTYPPPDTNTFIANHNHSPDGGRGSTDSLDKSAVPFLCAPVTPQRSPVAHAHSTPISSPVTNTNTNSNSNGDGGCWYSANATSSLSLEQLSSLSHDSTLAQSPPTPSVEVRQHQLRPRTLVEKARINVAWLDSSLSIMEQGVHEFDTLCLRFKFYSFYDLNAKYDAVRINQIYEQAKWQLLNEQIDCTDEEMFMFAALQLQINLQANQPQPNMDNGGSGSGNGGGNGRIAEDDIDAALTDLQVSLEGSNISSISNDITQVPELFDNLRFLKPKRFTLRAFKRYWFTCRDLTLYLYKTEEEAKSQNALPAMSVNLRGSEVTPEVNLSQSKYGIKLEVATTEGMSEMWIRCDTEDQYARWMAACRLASKGRSLADSSYETEVQSIRNFLQLQQPVVGVGVGIRQPQQLDVQAEDYVAPKFVRKLKGKVVQRILEAHANVKELPLIEAKLNYIKAWQSLPDYGISLFIIKFMGYKKEELLGVAHNRLMRMDLNTGDHIKTWRYNTMKAWNVNWEVRHMMVQFEEGNIVFSCLSADCKVIHEFIGGYIFLSMRSKEANQTLNEELFHKLTGGWV